MAIINSIVINFSDGTSEVIDNLPSQNTTGNPEVQDISEPTNEVAQQSLADSSEA